MSETHDGAAPAVTEDTAAVLTDATETEAPATAEDGDLGDDAAAETDAGDEGEQPKRKQTVQERINEKTRLQREAERERDYWREQAMRTQQPQPRQEPKAAAEDAEPDPNDYEHGELDARFIREHATYHAKKAFREEQARTEAERTRSQQLSAFETAADAEAQKHPDFYDVVGRDFGRTAAVCTPVMSDAIVASPDGPTLAYHLAKNPAEARRIAALTPLAQAVELGRLSAKLASPPAPTAKTATDAPAPTPQVRGQGGRFTVAPDTDDFAAFEKQFGP
jgi:hypothetical protein